MREGHVSQGQAAYEEPRLVELGTIAELTLATGNCTEKLSGSSDGLHFSSHHIVCTSH